MAVPETPTSEPIALKVVVVGGGIGGLAAAIECKQKGFEVVVLESTKEFTHVRYSLKIRHPQSQFLTNSPRSAQVSS